ncbi:cytochrome P450 [Rhodalgimonas zhirmunskyi]|uniref:Cytochrome P450 n=1 Tax=Rhodalgimonas zhirmunskyi TaxID=2964767 RepID=A0AAJ1UA47_9RHOB|nr:cytochrome P450 [Rhodoalgimonas zhirmunskyi]MDQ2095759.1 cytochrome P450 [Rhodoalgimonas zhirmunskyi]
MTTTETDALPVEALPVHVPLVTEPLGLMGSLAAARRNLLEILPDLAVRQPMVSGRTGIRWHMVMEPAAIRRMLLENIDNYPKSVTTKNLLKPAIGDSLFIAEGAHWRWQRRAAAPAFSHRNVSALGPVMGMAAQNSLDRVEAAGKRAVDYYEEMVRATFEVIGNVTFSEGAQFDPEQVHSAIDDYIAAAGKVSILDMLGVPGWVPRPGRLLSKRAVGEMKALADQSVEARKATGPGMPPDLLDLLLEGEDPETKRKMNTAELRDNLLTFIVAGHETTALTLSWALYLCAFDQGVQDRAREEAQAVLQGRVAEAKDLDSLPFIRMIVDETLRLYPPAGILSRTAREADELGGREIRPGDTVMIPIYALHRNRLLWDDPDAFRPERFKDRKEIERYAYLPFGDGPRICIGVSFAVQEAVIILATLLSKRRFSLLPGKAPKPVMILTLRPEGGVWLTSEPA